MHARMKAPLRMPRQTRAHRLSIAFALTFLISFGCAAAQVTTSCGICHRSLTNEWKKSAHSQAWKSASFQEQLRKYGSEAVCGSCHAPETVWQRVDLLPKAGGQETPTFQALLHDRASIRQEHLDDGVACGSCHYIKIERERTSGEGIIGPYHTVKGHQGNEVADFRSYKLCGACHGRPEGDYAAAVEKESDSGFHHSQVLPIAFAFQKSDCSSCHMPRREGRLVQLSSFRDLPDRMVGEHIFSGQRYERLAEALELTFDTQDGQTVLCLTNAKVGHALRISTTTTYSLVIAPTEGDEASPQVIALDMASTLQPGQTVRLPVRFDSPGGRGLRVELHRQEGGQDLKVFEKEF